MSRSGRTRAIVASFLALWVPVLIGLPMRVDPAGSAMGAVSMWGGHGSDGAASHDMAGMAGMSHDVHAEHHGAHRAATGGETHHHDHCCIICPCCGAVVPLPVSMPAPQIAPVAAADRIDARGPLAHRWHPDAERPPPRAPPTLLEA